MSVKMRTGFGVALLAAALAGGLWLIPSQDAGALPPYSKLFDYYSNASFTTLVGVCFRSCNGFLDCEPDTQKTDYWVTELDYECSGSSNCCIRCWAAGRIPCPQHILNNYPCGECSW